MRLASSWKSFKQSSISLVSCRCAEELGTWDTLLDIVDVELESAAQECKDQVPAMDCGDADGECNADILLFENNTIWHGQQFIRCILHLTIILCTLMGCLSGCCSYAKMLHLNLCDRCHLPISSARLMPPDERL